MSHFLSDPLIWHALLAGTFASLIGGIIGSYIVVKRMVFLSGSISHSVLGGIGLALFIDKSGYFPFPPLLGTLVGAIFSALLIGWVHLSFREREDTIISAVWTIGISLGVLLISFTPGYNVELNNFLIGNIVWISQDDLLVLGISSLFVLLSVLFLHKRLLSFSFDEMFSALSGLSVQKLYFALLLLVSISIVLLIQSVGVILVMSMLTIPPAIANQCTRRLSSMMILASLLGSLFTWLGIFLSYTYDLPVGATIALVSGLAYLVVMSAQHRRQIS